MGKVSLDRYLFDTPIAICRTNCVVDKYSRTYSLVGLPGQSAHTAFKLLKLVEQDVNVAADRRNIQGSQTEA